MSLLLLFGEGGGTGQAGFATPVAIGQFARLGATGGAPALSVPVLRYHYQQEVATMWLRQSTASQEILLGPFVDSTDGDTAETGLSIANTDIKIWKEGGTTEANKNSGGATHIAGGRYYAVLDATDTDTLGKLELHVKVAGALAVRRCFHVVPAMVYDSLLLGSDRFDANVTHVADQSQTARDIGATLGVAGAGLTAIPWNASWDAEVQSEVADALGVYDPPTHAEVTAGFTEIKGATWSSGTDTLEAIRDRGDAAWITATGFSTLDAAGVRAAVGLDSANMDAQFSSLATLVTGVGDEIGNAGDGLTAIPWNAAWDAEVQSEVDDALIAKGLDHLVFTSVAGADVADNSIIAKLVSKSATADWDSFSNTTDALEAIRDRGDAAWITATGFSTLTQADVRTAVGLASANLDTQLGTIVADTNELQVDWANGGRLDNILDARASQTSVDDVPTANENADALLKRDWTSVTGEASRSTLNALRFLRNAWSVVDTTLSVKKEDDSTEAWQGEVSSDLGVDPITGVDPS